MTRQAVLVGRDFTKTSQTARPFQGQRAVCWATAPMNTNEPNTKRGTDSRQLADSLDVDPLPTSASGDWPVEHNGDAFFPIPDSWISHPNAYDRDGNRERLFAVSAAASDGFVRVRYTHPTTPGVLVPETNWLAVDDSYVPRAIATTGWPRSITVYQDSPQDYRERCETRHLVELWSERSDDVQTDEEVKTMLADGGLPTLEDYL